MIPQRHNILVLFILCFTTSLFGQCFECVNYNTEIIEDITPRYWKDPVDISYPALTISVPNKIGLWTYYKGFINGDQQVISTRYVHCLEDIEARNAPNIQLNVYPNPTQSILFVLHNAPYSLIKVFNLNGQVLLEKSVSDTKVEQFDVSGFAFGFHIVTIFSEHGIKSESFIIGK